MKSDVYKVLHPIAGRAMLDHLLGVVDSLGPARKVVVVGAGREQVEHRVEARGGEIAVQEKQLGTAHAVLQEKDTLAGFTGDILSLSADTHQTEWRQSSRMADLAEQHET